MLEAALLRKIQRDLDFPFRIEPVLVLEERGSGAFDQVVGLAVLAVRFQDEIFQIHARRILGRFMSPATISMCGPIVMVSVKLPVLGRGVEIVRQGSGLRHGRVPPKLSFEPDIVGLRRRRSRSWPPAGASVYLAWDISIYQRVSLRAAAVSQRAALRRAILIAAMSERIQIFVTGGTFDKEYNELTGELFFKETHVPDMLGLGRSLLEVDIETLMMIDSLQMTDDHRRLILDHCNAAPHTRIVITHGTDTMEQTAPCSEKPLPGKPSFSPARWCPTSSAARTECSTWEPRWHLPRRYRLEFISR